MDVPHPNQQQERNLPCQSGAGREACVSAGALGVLTHLLCSRVFREELVVLWCWWRLRGQLKLGVVGVWGVPNQPLNAGGFLRGSLRCWCSPQGTDSALPSPLSAPSQGVLTPSHSTRGSNAAIGSPRNPVSRAGAGTPQGSVAHYQPMQLVQAGNVWSPS